MILEIAKLQTNCKSSPRVCGGNPKKPKKGNKKELLELITLLINLTVAILGLIKEFLK